MKMNCIRQPELRPCKLPTCVAKEIEAEVCSGKASGVLIKDLSQYTWSLVFHKIGLPLHLTTPEKDKNSIPKISIQRTEIVSK